MGRLIMILLLLPMLAGCDKRTEDAAKMSGLWKIESTRVETFESNQLVKDSLVEQSGYLSLLTTGGLQNSAATSLQYAPCWESCEWEIPKKKRRQIFFSYYSESSLLILSSSVMVQKCSGRKLVLVKIAYDGDLNMLSRSTWEFSKAKL